MMKSTKSELLTPKKFFKYILIDVLSPFKSFDYISEYIEIYDELNGPLNYNRKLQFAYKSLFLVLIFQFFHFITLGFVELDQLHSILYLDYLQYECFDKRFSFGFSFFMLLILFLYYECYIDCPPCLIEQMKSIQDNNPKLLFSWPYVYKNKPPVKSVKLIIEKFLQYFNILCFGQGLLMFQIVFIIQKI